MALSAQLLPIHTNLCDTFLKCLTNNHLPACQATPTAIPCKSMALPDDALPTCANFCSLLFRQPTYGSPRSVSLETFHHCSKAGLPVLALIRFALCSTDINPFPSFQGFMTFWTHFWVTASHSSCIFDFPAFFAKCWFLQLLSFCLGSYASPLQTVDDHIFYTGEHG